MMGTQNNHTGHNLEPDRLTDFLLDNIREIPYMRPEDIPDIGLYMDQVTTLMEDILQGSLRHEGDKILTKTMINNYTKNKLLPPPDRKKYSRDHLLILLYIYYFKGFLSLQDIQALLRPMDEQYFHNQEGPDVEDIYRTVFENAFRRKDRISEDLSVTVHEATELFTDQPPEDRTYLQLFALICSLSVDVYVRKKVIEQLIDQFMQPGDAEKKAENKRK